MSEDEDRCPTCQGRVWIVRRGEWVAHRETVGMACQTCGRDYAAPPAPLPVDTSDTFDPTDDGGGW